MPLLASRQSYVCITTAAFTTWKGLKLAFPWFPMGILTSSGLNTALDTVLQPINPAQVTSVGCNIFDWRWEIISLRLRHGSGMTLVAHYFLTKIRKDVGETHKYETEKFVRFQELLSKSVGGAWWRLVMDGWLKGFCRCVWSFLQNRIIPQSSIQ